MSSYQQKDRAFFKGIERFLGFFLGLEGTTRDPIADTVTFSEYARRFEWIGAVKS